MITLFSGFSFSQAIVQGKLVDHVSGEPLPGVVVRSLYPDNTKSDNEGHFSIRHKSNESIKLFFVSNGESVEWNSLMIADGTVDVGMVAIQPGSSDHLINEYPTLILDENDIEEGASISALLQTGDDLFAGIT
ncbi:MAG TPA: hypothetical protein VMZ69_06815, partial [Saprospiraceae bacterium]|nr:hypothetical protein [Saprospiraceae bacterium]